MNVPDTAGAKLFLGPANSLAVSKSDYDALVYTQVKQVETIPQIGPTSSVVKFTPLETGVVHKRIGSVDNGEPEIVCFLDNSDLGQLAMLAARVDRGTLYAFKVTLADDVGVGPPSAYYFHAFVTSSSSEVGAADNINRRRFGLAIDGDILEFHAPTS